MAKKKKKIKGSTVTAAEKYKYTLKMVTSETCIACKKQCPRGLAYIEKMSKPGAVGRGVPCILTKGKPYK
ncbi:hypothetical protein MM300_21800 [Evansella sp. LMS18]|jgi:hypothetical protein|uniref:hypothetical protein n=1 Tax=Evansella sp. LMS18 TaxID=2924033 RepID=UPI0020D172C6|nr:hypothetical protein [Evansella sp. LMS18]UTR10469.1 hypothetical protein MM300_21800 [Evansella sp. LMS18]